MSKNLDFITEVRRDFPILNGKVNGKKFIYLDNAATTQKPVSMIDFTNSFYSNFNASSHSQHFLANKITTEYENSRQFIKDFIGAQCTEEIVFTSGATESLNLLSFCLQEQVDFEDEILITQMEHHANILPWQRLAKIKNAKLIVCPILEDGSLDETAFENLLNSKTKIVSLTHASNVLGTINNIKKLTSTAHKKNALVIIDGTQAAAHFKVNCKDLDCDFYVFSGHKVFGPTGIGVLYGKKKLLDKLSPYQVGGEMVKNVTFQTATFEDAPTRFEAGTQNFAGVLGLKASLEYFVGIREQFNLEEYEQSLLIYLTKKLNQIQGLKIIGNSQNKLSLVSFVIEDVNSFDLAVYLDAQGIAIRVGSHCAQPLLKSLNLDSTARISLCFYNTFEEIDFTVQQIQKALEILR